MDYKVDAKNKPFGRIASEVALILSGKKSAEYDPSKVSKDRALLSNIGEITISGNKAKDKMYYRHTGYMGHLKEQNFETAFKKDPKKVFREAVLNMLPKNFLRSKRILNLVFIEDGKESN